MAATRVYDVPDIHCGHCKAAIEGEVAQLPGVTSVAVDIDARSVTVAGDAGDDSIIAAIGEAGYEVAGTA